MSMSRDKKSAIFLLVILAIIVAVSVVIAMSLRVDPIQETMKNDPVVKILFVHTDDEKNVLSTDILVYCPGSDQAVSFNILGNTGAIYKSINRVDRIDAVYKELGIETYKGEIEKLVGKSIPFTVEYSMSDLEFFADYLGGLNVFVPMPVDEIGPDGEKWLLPSGAVSLDGDKIKIYETYRLSSETQDDVEDRRQAAFTALLAAFRDNKKSVYNAKIFPVFAKHFTTNVDYQNFYRLMMQVSDIDTERIVTQTITGSARTVESGQTLLFPLYDGQLIKDVMDQSISSLLTGDYGNQNRAYVLSIQNGTSTQGLARNTSFLMQSAGYEVLEISNAPATEKTVIINRIGNSEAAKALGKFIRCTNIVDEDYSEEEESNGSAKADFTIILGKDFDGRIVR
ncbi:MAG: LCP family protein [Treponema sp.]|uniref:LCP family protein n=1 Tax=Treponema sp. TaxID=166 RepID=UPI001DA80D57|nr:LytR C-terminal domain-containing protein [Treponema sp.]MBS7241172.1 LCP family protein [Treponema sp.]